MKCIYCGSKEMSYDNATSMWSCSDCQRIYDEEEVEKETGVSVLALFMLAFLCLIPIVNLFVVYGIVNSIVNDKYRNTFIAVVLTQYFVIVLTIVYLIVWQHSQVKQQATEVFSKVESYVSTLNVKSIDKRYNIHYRTDYSEFLPEVKQEENLKIDTLTKDLYLFSGITMTGSKVMELTKAYEETTTVMLIQTCAIKEKHGKDTYRNFNLRINNTVDGSDELIKYFNIKDEISVFTTDYSEFEYLPLDDLTKKKYIFYVNPKSEYEFIYENVEDYNVFIFKELED